MKKLYLLDIDGTISLDATLFEGSLDFLNWVNEIGGKYIFITNNSTTSIADYVEKFTKMGVKVDETNFLTSSFVMGRYLKEHFSKNKIFVVGTKSFIKELKELKLDIVTDLQEFKEISCAVVGFDNELNFEKVTDICRLLEQKDIPYVATNPDYACPTSFGFVPDCGAICEFISHATKKMPIYIGKPAPTMVELSRKTYGYTKEETIVVGDRLYTDIACGIAADVDTAVVFTGEAKEEDMKTTEFVPNYCCQDIREFHEKMKALSGHGM